MKRLGAMLLAVATIAMVTACGSSSDSGSTTAASTGSSSSSTGTTKLPSATIGLLLGQGQSEVLQRWASTLKTAAAAVGWKVEVTDGKGDPSVWGQAITNFVNQRMTGIVTIGLDAAPVAQQLKAAQQANIPVIATGITVAPADIDLFTAHYAPSDAQYGQTLASYLKSKLPTGSEFTQLDASANYGAHEAIVSADPALKAAGFKLVGNFDMDISDLVNQVAKGAAALATAHPQQKFMLSCCDLTPPITVPALKQAGSPNVISASRFDNLSSLKLVRAGDPVVLAVANSDTGVLITLDQLLALKAKGTKVDPTADKGKYQFDVVDKDNVPPAGQFFFPPSKEISQYVAQWKSEYQW